MRIYACMHAACAPLSRQARHRQLHSPPKEERLPSLPELPFMLLWRTAAPACEVVVACQLRVVQLSAQERRNLQGSFQRACGA